MRAIDRKLLRDLWGIKEQSLAIALVIGCGVAVFVMSLSTLSSLQLTRQMYYERYRFAEVFGHLKRAPETLRTRIAEIPGVARVQTRTVVDVTLDVRGWDEPAVGHLISIPEDREPELNGIYLRRGRLLQPGDTDEVLVSEGFAGAHGLEPGDEVAAIINRRKRNLRIVGIALSPEYVYHLRAGDLFPDDRRFGVFWMGNRGLEAAFDMQGAFNNVCLQLMPGANETEVIRRLDRLIEPYGGLGSYGRVDHMSDRFLSDELKQLRTMAVLAPSIFLSVAAFLLNVVLARIINTQREQIAALKAFGYGNAAVGLHYLKLVILIVALGVVLGTGVGIWMGRNLTRMYMQFYRFPILNLQLRLDVICLAALISAAAAIVGTLGAVYRAVRLPPAEAMRPEPPADYQPTLMERIGLAGWLSTPIRMILRHMERQPVKSGLSIIGIAMAVAVLIVGAFSADALDYIIDVQFLYAQRQDINVAFVEPRPVRTLHELTHLPGVVSCEGFRGVAVRLRHAHHTRRLGLLGLPTNARLQRLIDDQERIVPLPANGLVMASKLAEVLGVRLGDWVTVEVLEGTRPVRQVPVVQLVSQFIGAGAYMNLDALNHMLREGRTISGGYLTTDSQHAEDLYHTLKHTPGVAGVTIRKASIRSFQETLAENMLRMRMFNIGFAVIIASGVVYNSARIALAERTRELATLRVMGFTRGEISLILLGELGVLMLAALPVGLLMGYGLVGLLVRNFDTEMYRIPLIIDPSTYGAAVAVVIVAAVISGLIVRRKLDHLDLVATLKTRD